MSIFVFGALALSVSVAEAQGCAGANSNFGAYVGRDMKTAHKGMKISDAEWNATVENFGKALDKHKVGAAEKKELISAIAPMRGDIVGW